jgi:signal peptidase I
MKTLKLVLSKIFATVIIIVMPVIAFLLIASFSNVLFGIRAYDVVTGSMVPTIPIGSLILTIPNHQYQVGNIITFKRNDEIVTHRIVGKRNNLFITKGDANPQNDPQPVGQVQIIGKDIFIAPFIGKVIRFVKSLTGFLLFIALPILIFIGFEIKNIKKEFEKEIEKKMTKKYETAQQSQ